MKVTQSSNDQLMVIAAHRYCLGRESYIVPACTEFLRQVWPDLTGETQQAIIRDTEDPLATGQAGTCSNTLAW